MTRDDVLGLFDFAHGRLMQRLTGLSDDEWSWLPTDDPDLGLQWRLAHLVQVLGEDRNARWLGREPTFAAPFRAGTAADAVSATDAAFTDWRGHLAALDGADLTAPVGRVGGAFADSSRLAFVLHVADEYIHHGAEAGLLRDLYAHRAT